MVVVVLVVVVVDFVVVDVVDVEHDASNIATTTRKLKPNQKNLFFNFVLLFYESQTYFAAISMLSEVFR